MASRANLLRVYRFVIPFALPSRHDSPRNRPAAHAAFDTSETRGLLREALDLGDYFIWLAPRALKRLMAAREPGEVYRYTIVRLAKEEASAEAKPPKSERSVQRAWVRAAPHGYVRPPSHGAGRHRPSERAC
jgi:hypothetical protein